MKKSASKSRMLLLELLLAVFIFSFCVIICAGVFFEASNIARDSKNLTYANQVAQSAAEAFKMTDSFEEYSALLNGIRQDDAFVVTSSQEEQDGVQTARIQVVDRTGEAEKILVEISVSKLVKEAGQ